MRRVSVISFLLCLFVNISSSSAGILLGIMIPRVPSFSFNSNTPLVQATGSWNSSVPTYFNRAPANFSFPAFASLEVDTGSNYLPLTFNHLRANIYDLQTNRLVANGDLGHKSLPAKAFPHILLPLNFTYIATNDTDQTCMFHAVPCRLMFTDLLAGLNWYNGCKNAALYVNGNRPGALFDAHFACNRLPLYSRPIPSHT